MYQEINTLELRLHYVKEEIPEIIDGILFKGLYYIDIFINHVNLREKEGFEDMMVVFSELKKSIEKNGKYLIFTCACGVAGDGGWEGVYVNSKRDSIEWDFVLDECRFLYVFNKKKFIEEINEMDLIIREKGAKNSLEPKFVVFPENW